MSEVAGAAGGAPHGRIFYVFVALLGLAGGTFFAVASLSSATDAEIGWRVAFALPVGVFFVGVAQAAERLFRPARAVALAAGWPVAVRARFLWCRRTALGVAFGGGGALTVLRHFLSPPAADVCDDLRVLCWTLVFAGFFLADVVGERMLDGSKLRERLARPPAPPPPRLSRRRRSGLTVQDGSR